jgi:hypothetical protein
MPTLACPKRSETPLGWMDPLQREGGMGVAASCGPTPSRSASPPPPRSQIRGLPPPPALGSGAHPVEESPSGALWFGEPPGPPKRSYPARAANSSSKALTASACMVGRTWE